MELPGLLAAYGQQIEADLQHYYQVDLLDLYRGRMTPRRCWVLISQLPPGAAMYREMGGQAYFSHEENTLRAGFWQITSSLAGKQLPAPEVPEIGWRDKQRQVEEKRDRRLAAHERRRKASG